MTARLAAYETLLLCEKEKQFSNIAVSNGIKKHRFDDRERDFYTQLVYGVIEKRITLDYLIQQYTQKSVKRLDTPVVLILRLAIYQIQFLDKVPNSAAVSEAVKMAARFASRAKGYINAILRRIAESDIVYPDRSDWVEYASVFYSVNADICALLREQYGDFADEILAAYNRIPRLTLQVNCSLHTPKTFIDAYRLNAMVVPPFPFAVRMSEKVSVSSQSFLKNGDAFVQDLASQLTSLVLDPMPGMTVVDVCSCPGGKSFSAANMMLSRRQTQEPIGNIISCDLHESKLSLVENGAKRLGFDMIQTLCHDATTPLQELKNAAQRVICDVPCSGLGVISKKPEIRYKDISEVCALPELQYQILESSATYLTADGILLYSTCTLNKKENEKVVNRFIQEHSDFETVDFSFVSEDFSFVSQNGCLTLFPNEWHDGFFLAKIRRK